MAIKVKQKPNTSISSKSAFKNRLKAQKESVQAFDVLPVTSSELLEFGFNRGTIEENIAYYKLKNDNEAFEKKYRKAKGNDLQLFLVSAFAFEKNKITTWKDKAVFHLRKSLKKINQITLPRQLLSVKNEKYLRYIYTHWQEIVVVAKMIDISSSEINPVMATIYNKLLKDGHVASNGKTKKCEICKTPFPAYPARKKYCSSRCGLVARQRKHRGKKDLEYAKSKKLTPQ